MALLVGRQSSTTQSTNEGARGQAGANQNPPNLPDVLFTTLVLASAAYTTYKLDTNGWSIAKNLLSGSFVNSVMSPINSKLETIRNRMLTARDVVQTVAEATKNTLVSNVKKFFFFNKRAIRR